MTLGESALGHRTVASDEARDVAGIDWSVSAALAFDRMRYDRRRLLAVVDGERVIGRIYRRDLDDLDRRGTWLSSVLVRDVMRRAA
jgi:hypothetical protein